MGAGRHLTHYPLQSSLLILILIGLIQKKALKKGLQVIEKTCKPLINLGRHIQTRTGDLYDVNVAL